MGNFLGHFKASRCSQSSASSYHPTAELCVPVKPPRHHPQPQSCLLGISECRNPSPEPQAHAPSHCTTAALAEKNCHGGTGQILNQHSSLLLLWDSTYPLLHPGDRGSWRNRNSAWGQVKVITFQASQQDSAEDLYDNPWRHLIQCLYLFF